MTQVIGGSLQMKLVNKIIAVNWWRMGDNDNGTGTTITDQGSGGNDGTLTNGPTFSSSVPS